MAIADLVDWFNHFGRPETLWYAKRLSANDTLANAAHQAGPYVPKDVLFTVFPDLNRPEAENPDHRFDLYVDSHPDHRLVRAVWYNGKVRGDGTRNETRLTGFGGARSALLDPDSTGAIAILVFVLGDDAKGTECHVWVAGNEIEEDIIEERLGPVEPKKYVIWKPGSLPEAEQLEFLPKVRNSCRLQPKDIPDAWMRRFPSGEEIIKKTLELRPRDGTDPDVRLLRRRQCEYEVFLSVEEAVYEPRIRAGFQSLSSFIALAQTLLQSRKSRSGNSLEIHTRHILSEEGLILNSDFAYKPTIENGKKPDFIFPTVQAYGDPAFPAEKLRMLAAKTTCKDRWRQVINEADRIAVKHLLTLQEGVSVGQFREMCEAGVALVVPAGLADSYPEEVRPHLITLESFIGDIRLLNLGRE